MLPIFMITLLLGLPLPTHAQSAFHVIVDPGHGGSDLGATKESFVESKIVLSIAEKLKAKLKQQNIQVTLTRESDSHLTLQQRVQMANELKADLFLSLHANWSRSVQVSGFEFYFATPPALTAKSTAEKVKDVVEKIRSDLTLLGRQKESLKFSQQTQQQISDQKSVIRRAPFYVIENTTMPAVLIEVGFISNRREAKKLSSPEYQSEIADVLSKSVLSYKQKNSALQRKE